jgi:hypothetical protein
MDEFDARILLHDCVLKMLINFLAVRGVLDMQDFLKYFDAIVVKICSMNPDMEQAAAEFRECLTISPQEAQP